MLMTKQEIFDKVATHLLTQKETSYDGNLDRCLYRSTDGKKCAAGVLIPDELYNAKMDWSDKAYSWKRLIETWPELDVGHKNLVEELQSIHDNSEPESWKEELLNVADVYGLDASVILNVKINN